MDAQREAKRLGIATTNDSAGWHASSNVMCLFRPATLQMIRSAEKQMGRDIPSSYRKFLVSSNGLYFSDWTLYGVAPSLFKNRLLNRQKLEPMAITTANNEWRYESAYPLKSTDWLLVGYREGERENKALFLDEVGVVYMGTAKTVKKLGDLRDLFGKMAKLPNK